MQGNCITARPKPCPPPQENHKCALPTTPSLRSIHTAHSACAGQLWRTRAQASSGHSLLIAVPSVQGHLSLMKHILPMLHKPPLSVLLACFAASLRAARARLAWWGKEG